MPIRRALLSVSDKSGLVEFARALAGQGISLLSTGGTYRSLEEAGVPVEPVEKYTDSPEVMSGRVKTLHPRIHGGILAREGTDEDDMARIGAEFIDLVVVNLYPFEQTLERPGTQFDELVENIDIGGPSMLRSAAKNHVRVAVVCDPTDYASVVSELCEHDNELSDETRRRLAAKAFAHTAAYDGVIASWLSSVDEPDKSPRSRVFAFEKGYSLRYGENPHQQGAFYVERSAPAGSLARARSVGAGAKELSFNNLVDLDAAMDCVRDFEETAAVVVKHASPCGVAVAPKLVDAYRAARDADALSAFGGVVALNREVDLATAETICETFIDCIIAPAFREDALEALRKKKALRILATGAWLPRDHQALTYKRIGGGLVVQQRDATGTNEVRKGKVVTRRVPTDEELAALEFAWVACKHVRSNAIAIARALGPNAYVSVGLGGGQVSRVGAVDNACRNAGDKAKGAVLASDAFFPFPDGLQAAAAAGVRAVVQPGGSKGDDKVIKAANDSDIAMIFTGVRHFKH